MREQSKMFFPHSKITKIRYCKKIKNQSYNVAWYLASLRGARAQQFIELFISGILTVQFKLDVHLIHNG